MNLSVESSLSTGSVDTILVFAFSDADPDLSGVGPIVAEALAAGRVRRKLYDVTPLWDGSAIVAVVGLGEKDKLTPIQWKRAAGAAVRSARDRGAKKVNAIVPDLGVVDGTAAVSLLVGGIVHGLYRSGRFKSSGVDANEIETVIVTSNANGAAEAAVHAKTVGEAVNDIRDLVNEPASHLNPAGLSERAAKLTGDAGLKVRSMGNAELEAAKMAGILAVGRGSKNASSFTVMEHLPNVGQAPVVLVGKGVTFDTGGISIKPASNMHEMKSDMGGAAAVIGAMLAVGRLNLPINVVGLVPSAENMPGGDAMRPSDVIEYANGKSAEVTNTDAEGRLILADGLIYGEREYKPRAMIDLATLTGSCVIALGTDIAGIFTKDDGLAEALAKASATSTEPAWRMPLYTPYRSKVDSPVADIRNSQDDRWGGSITAALFLAEFVDETPWAHIDIAGPAYDETERAWSAPGGTGYGVSLLVDFLERF